jgi:hypothetical protein
MIMTDLPEKAFAEAANSSLAGQDSLPGLESERRWDSEALADLAEEAC